jgi:23S rRNA pseudouridine2605 synthase
MLERLQKIIARAGISSRRAAEELITAGRVRVNGKVVTELGVRADSMVDKVELDGKRLKPESFVYVVLHKPRDVVSTLSDPEGRPTVAEMLKDLGRVYPVGRLDFATSGVLLATNDGDFSQGLLHPKKDVPKTYVMKVRGVMTDADLERWRTGVRLEDGMTLPAEAKLIRVEGDKTWIEVTLREGRNQQIRRMGDATGFPVMRLARVSFADISSEGLRPGEWRPLSAVELTVLREQYGVPKRIPKDVPYRTKRAPVTKGMSTRPGAETRGRQERPEADVPRARPSTGAGRGRGRPGADAPRGRPGADAPRGRPGAGRPEDDVQLERPTQAARPQRKRTDAEFKAGRSDRSGTKPRGAAERGPRARGPGGRSGSRGRP